LPKNYTKQLKLEIEELKNKNNELEEKAKNYMEKIKETNPEKLKEWRYKSIYKS
jgi:FtsZ-binding cell division protein ZapB